MVFFYFSFNLQGFDAGTVYESNNGFVLSVSNYYTRHLTVMSTIYGIPNGQDPVQKITSKSLKIH